jgi:hypothetical protein
LVAIAFGIYIAWASSQSEKDSARSQAHIEIDSLKAVHCTPDIAEDFDRINTQRFESLIDKSTLEPEEQQNLKNVYASAMEQAGCGFSARNQPKPGKHR